MSKADNWYLISEDAERVCIWGEWYTLDDVQNRLWKMMIAANVLAQVNGCKTHGIWCDGEDFLCKDEKQADAIADFLEALGFEYVRTAQYDPAEDERNGEVDDRTGFWYVSWD